MRDDRNSASSDPPPVKFAYTPNRQGQHPQRHLAGFKSVLQADAYAGFNDIYIDGTMHEAACMARARRKVHDRHPTATTTEALRRIGELYVIEAAIRVQSVAISQRVRQE